MFTKFHILSNIAGQTIKMIHSKWPRWPFWIWAQDLDNYYSLNKFKITLNISIYCAQWPPNHILSTTASQLITTNMTNIFKMAAVAILNLGAGLTTITALNNPQNYIFSSSVRQLITTNIFKMAAAAILNVETGFNISQIIKITSNMDSLSSTTPEIMYWAAL